MDIEDRELPLHIKIRNRIKEDIDSGKIRANERGVLPSQTWFAEDLGVGLTTIKRAVKELEDMGIVESRKRKGLILKNNALEDGSIKKATDILHFSVAFFRGFENIKHTRNSNLIMGIEACARDANIALHVSSFPGVDIEMDIAEDSLFSMYETQPINGLISLSPISPRSYAKLRDRGIPFIMIGYYSEEWANCHTPDAALGAYMVTESLLKRDKRNIALFTGNPNLLGSYLRQFAFGNALNKYGMSLNPDYISNEEYNYDAAIAFIQNLLHRGEPIDAVMAFDDVMGASIAEYLASIGRSDIIVGGSGNYEEYSDIVSVTTDYRYSEIGYSATKMLIDMAQGIVPERTKYYYEPMLIERYRK